MKQTKTNLRWYWPIRSPKTSLDGIGQVDHPNQIYVGEHIPNKERNSIFEKKIINKIKVM